MDYGEELEKRHEFWEQMAQKGQGPLANEPEVPYAGREAWDAFWKLSGSRTVGMGSVGGIPFLAVDRWADRYGVRDFETFHRLIVAMDAAYLKQVNK